MLRMRLEAGIQHASNCEVPLEESRDSHRILAVCRHAQRERAHPAQRKIAVEGRRGSAHVPLDVPQSLVEVRRVGHQHAHHHIAVPVDILGNRVQYDIRAERERTLTNRGKEGIVND